MSFSELLCAFLTVYMVVLAARAVLSWFPPSSSGSGLAPVQRLLMDLTEPVLAPLRRVIPPAGMFDLSFIVAFLGIGIIRTVVCSAG